MIALSNIPTHQLAQWLLQSIRGVLHTLGLPNNHVVEDVVYVAIVAVLALFLAWFIRRGVLFITQRLKFKVLKRKVAVQHYRHLLQRCSHIVSPLVILGMLPFAFGGQSTLYRIVHTLVVAYLIISISIALGAIINFIWERFNARENTKNLPLAGIRNLCVGIVWIVSVIIIGSVVLDKSPVALLTGLGAFATVLMLIFRDSILGFVAGLQLSQNDMVRIGDWIVVPSTIANGIVEDMSLSTVKVRNWDNTIVMLPPYTLVSTSFQNWRGMTDSGSRLISRSVVFTVDSVVAASDALLQTIEPLPGMQEFINRVNVSGQYYDGSVAGVNGTAQSNLGLFRAYMCGYLLEHQQVDSSQQILVRIMPIDGSGVPLQIYCYTSTNWTIYEAVQSEIMEHLLTMAPHFGLQPYSAPSNEDIRSLVTRE